MEIPLFGPGTRVELVVDGALVSCRALRMQGRSLHVSVPDSATSRLSGRLAAGSFVPLTLYARGSCWEVDGTVREWLWTRPAQLVIGGLEGWRELPRRQEPRAVQEREVCLWTEDGGRWHGRSRDISRVGISALLPGAAPLAVGARAALEIRQDDDDWSDAFPIRVVRLENWLHAGAGSRAQLVGMALQTDQNPRLQRVWDEWLCRIRSDDDAPEARA
jgi:hypothetical protein